jgi:hypothetical protein
VTMLLVNTIASAERIAQGQVQEFHPEADAGARPNGERAGVT